MEGTAEGDRGAFQGVYLFSQEYDRYNKVLGYCPLVGLWWKGILYQCCFELRYHNAIVSNAHGDQTVCHSDDIVLAALYVRCVERRDLVPGADWICVSMDNKLWEPLYECNPLDPGSKFACNFDFNLGKFVAPPAPPGTAVPSAGQGTATAVPSAGLSLAMGDRAHDIQAQTLELESFAPLLTNLPPHANVPPHMMEYYSAWEVYARNGLSALLSLYSAEYENMVHTALSATDNSEN